VSREGAWYFLRKTFFFKQIFDFGNRVESVESEEKR
jgi:hypothetical protein